ncbi:MAG: hypothetical protein ACRDJ5_06925 [Actinomycetota bacterium]
MGRKFWIGWALSYVGFALVYAVIWLVRPPRPGASSGLDPQRAGITAAIVAIPRLLGAVRVGKLHRSSAGKYAIPILLSVALFVVSFSQGFLPDDPAACATLASFGDPLPPECFTPFEVRAKSLLEATVVWLGFGVVSLLIGWWRARHPVMPDA